MSARTSTPLQIAATAQQLWERLSARWSSTTARELHSTLQLLSDRAFKAEHTALSIPALEFSAFLRDFVDSSEPPSAELGNALARLAARVHSVASAGPQTVAAEEQPLKDKKPSIYALHSGDQLDKDFAGLLRDRGYLYSEFQKLDALGAALNRRAPEALICGHTELTRLIDFLDSTEAQSQRRYPIVAVAQSAGARVPGADCYLLRPSPSELLAEVENFVYALKKLPGRVLVVDDDLTQLMFCEAILTQGGMRVATASSGGEALERLLDFKPELLLVDLYMPGIDGMELTQRVRERADSLLTPIVLLTGESDPQKRFELLDAGGDDYLIKPVRPMHLVTAVRSRIQRAREIGMALRPAAIAVDRATTSRSGLLLKARAALTQHRDKRGALAMFHVVLDQGKTLRDRLSILAMTELEDALARQLSRCLNRGDEIAYWQDFSFGILAHRESEPDLRKLGERIVHLVREKPYFVGGTEQTMTVSVGFASAGVARGQFERWVNATITASGSASRRGGNQMEGAVGAAEGLSQEQSQRLRHLLSEPPTKRNTLVEFRPLVQLRGAVSGQYESMMRLRDGSQGTPMPLSLYRSLARELGVIDRLEQFLTLQVVQTLSQLSKAAPARLLVPMEINARSADFFAELGKFKHVWQATGRSLGFVLDADAVSADLRRHVELAKLLNGFGLRVAVSRVGGQSNLAQLFDQLPFELLFLKPDLVDARDAGEARELIRMATDFGREVVVSDVSDRGEIDRLWTIGVHYVSGDGISEPRPVLDFEFGILSPLG